MRVAVSGVVVWEIRRRRRRRRERRRFVRKREGMRGVVERDLVDMAMMDGTDGVLMGTGSCWKGGAEVDELMYEAR